MLLEEFIKPFQQKTLKMTERKYSSIEQKTKVRRLFQKSNREIIINS